MASAAGASPGPGCGSRAPWRLPSRRFSSSPPESFRRRVSEQSDIRSARWNHPHRLPRNFSLKEPPAQGNLYLNPVTTVNLSKGFVSSKTTTGTRVMSLGSPRQAFVAITVPSRPALKTTVPSALMVTGIFLFSPGANLFPGPKFSPSVKTWAFSFERFVISATTVL